MDCICKKYRGIVLARLFIRALLVLMRVALLESVFRKYLYSTIKMMHGPINIRCLHLTLYVSSVSCQYPG